MSDQLTKCGRCTRCWRYENEHDYNLVSPSGVTHIGAEHGKTACGIDATGFGWSRRF